MKRPSGRFICLIMLTRPAAVLRIEEACLLFAATLLYHYMHFSWVLLQHIA